LVFGVSASRSFFSAFSTESLGVSAMVSPYSRMTSVQKTAINNRARGSHDPSRAIHRDVPLT
jgi:hypothetical protein